MFVPRCGPRASWPAGRSQRRTPVLAEGDRWPLGSPRPIGPGLSLRWVPQLRAGVRRSVSALLQRPGGQATRGLAARKHTSRRCSASRPRTRVSRKAAVFVHRQFRLRREIPAAVGAGSNRRSPCIPRLVFRAAVFVTRWGRGRPGRRAGRSAGHRSSPRVTAGRLGRPARSGRGSACAGSHSCGPVSGDLCRHCSNGPAARPPAAWQRVRTTRRCSSSRPRLRVSRKAAVFVHRQFRLRREIPAAVAPFERHAGSARIPAAVGAGSNRRFARPRCQSW